MAEAGLPAYFGSVRALGCAGVYDEEGEWPAVVHGREENMTFATLIPIVAVVVGVPGFVAFVALLIGHARKMKELEIKDKELELTGSDAALGPALDALRDDLSDTRAQVAEMQERLDFAERVLAAGSPPRES